MPIFSLPSSSLTTLAIHTFLDNFANLYVDGGTTGLTFSTDRSEPWNLQETICKMEIRITENVIALMTEEGNTNFYDLFTTLCGEGFVRCKEG
jgi:hypothetical protein